MMKYPLTTFAAAIALCIPTHLIAGSPQSAEEYVQGSYIVVFKNDVKKSEVKGLALALGRGAVKHTYKNTIKGFSARISLRAAQQLAKHWRVAYVEEDQVATAIAPSSRKKPTDKPGKPGGGDETDAAPQETPWGITRVGGSGFGLGKTAWVIDSGIDLDHPDLNVDTARWADFVDWERDRGGDDLNGHGSHVAGTIAALNNSTGVVGVAAGAKVVPVRVLDRRGSGSYSGVIAGVDYVAANGSAGDVANMSLGGPVSTALDDAVKAAAQTGIRFSLAAGNESDYAGDHSPARAEGNNIYTVSAIDSSDRFAYFSNSGNPPIDFAAPGVSVLSTYKNGGYATLNGTSMAAPHVAGLLLLGDVSSNGTAIGDPDGYPDPIAHR
jgi:subtilisin family serine protease